LKRLILTFSALLVFLTFLAGCGIYTFGGSVPSHLSSVAIPMLENQTAEFGLAETITEELIEQFTIDNSLKVKELRNADSAIFATVVRIADQPSTYNANETVEEYKVTLVVKVRYEDLVEKKVVWEETISQFGVYPFSGGSSAERESGLLEAVDKLVEQVINKTVSGW